VVVASDWPRSSSAGSKIVLKYYVVVAVYCGAASSEDSLYMILCLARGTDHTTTPRRRDISTAGAWPRPRLDVGAALSPLASMAAYWALEAHTHIAHGTRHTAWRTDNRLSAGTGVGVWGGGGPRQWLVAAATPVRRARALGGSMRSQLLALPTSRARSFRCASPITTHVGPRTQAPACQYWAQKAGLVTMHS
jgi:hypothetical protein